MNRILFILIIILSFHCGLVSQIFNVEDRRGTFSDSLGMHETLDLGISLNKNTKTVTSIKGTFQIEVLQKSRIFLSISKFNFVKAGGEDFVNQGFQHLRFNRLFNNNIEFETYGQIQYNTLVFIKLRALAGGGFKFELYNRPKQKVNYGLSVMYEYNEEAVDDITRSDVRVSNYFSIALKISETARFSSTTYFQPRWNKIADYRLSTQSTLRFKFLGNVDFKVSFSLTYDSRVPDDFVKTIYSLSNGISYRF